MTISTSTTATQPAVVFDKVHLMRYVIQRATTPPYIIKVDIEAIRYALDQDGVTRVFDPAGSFHAVINDYEGWLTGQVAAASGQAEVDKLNAMHLGQEDILAEMLTRTTQLDCVGPGQFG